MGDMDRLSKRLEQMMPRVERGLIKVGIILAIVLVIMQGMLQFPALRTVLTQVDRMEGVPYHND